MNYTRFNRHENMDSETRNEIMDLIKETRFSETEDSETLTNMLYGLFDGYLYEELQIMALKQSTEMASRIQKVYFTCSRYPKSVTQVY